MSRTALVGAVVVAWIAGFGVVRAETGMGLMVDSKVDKVRRVDLKDGNVVATSAAIGSNIVMGRFSPDGSKMAVAHWGSPYITIYNTSDWSKITDPTELPSTSSGKGVVFSP